MTTRRYEPILKIASGGTAAVHVGAASGSLGFRQLVAIKRPHAHLADDPAFVAALVEEAKIASRLHHANIVDVRDIEADEAGVQLVMDYVEGASLSDLIRGWDKDQHAVALRIVLDVCEGLRAVHELLGDDLKPLGLVHRDVSPANILVGIDGVARIADFGLAKPLLAVDRTTSEGSLRGKLGYMAPEYIRGREIDRRVDVFATGVVLWEALARKRLFRGENDAETLDRIQREDAPRLADIASSLPSSAATAIDNVIAKALAKSPASRYPTVDALAAALEKIGKRFDLIASHAHVRESFPDSVRVILDDRRKRVQASITSAAASSSPSEIVLGAADTALPTFSPLAGSIVNRGPAASPLAGSLLEPIRSPLPPRPDGSVPSSSPLAGTLNEPIRSPLPPRPPSDAPPPSSMPSPLAGSVIGRVPSSPPANEIPSRPPMQPSYAPIALADTIMDAVTLAAISSAPPPRSTGAPAASASPVSAPPRRASPPVGVIALGAIAVLAIAIYAITREGSAPPAPVEPHPAASDIQPRSDTTRIRATPIDEASSAAPTTSSPSAMPPTQQHPHPPSTEPGSKTPRPNPYPDKK